MLNKVKRSVIIATIICVGFLSSCSKGPSGDVSSALGDSSPETANVTEEAIGTLDDVLSEIKANRHDPDIQVVEKITLNDNWLLVNYDTQSYNEFLLFNVESGTYNVLARNATLIRAENEDHLVFEILGDWDEGGFLRFPYIEEYTRKADSENELDGFYVIHQKEYFDLNRSVKGGTKESDKLSAICSTFNSVEFLFTPADEEAGGTFYAGSS